jgi:glucose-6-phosphate isomerase, archaeal
MKKAKIIIFLQVAFLVMTIAFSTSIAFNNGPGQGISLSVADKAVNLALRNANLEIADPASGVFQEQLRNAHDIAGIWQEIKNGNIPDNAKELAGIPGAYLVSFTVKVNGQDQQAMVVIAQEEIPSLQGQRDSALSFGDINVYIPPASLFTDTDAAKASSAGAVNIPVEFPILEIPHGYYDAEIPARIIKGENPGQILFNSTIIGSNLYMVPIKPLPDGTSHLVMGPENHDSELALLALGLQKDADLTARYGVLIARPTTELLQSVLAQREAFSGVPAKASSAGVVTFVGKHIITYSNEEELIARFMADTNFAAANPAFMEAISSLKEVHLDGLKDAVSDLAAGPTADNNWIGPIEEVSEGIYTLSMLVQANIADERGLSLMPLLIKANSESMDGANVNLKVHPIISIQPVDDRVAEELAVIKSSSAGFDVNAIIGESRAFLGALGKKINPDGSSLGVLAFSGDVFQKRDVGGKIIGSVTPSGQQLSPDTPLRSVYSHDSVRRLGDLAPVMLYPMALNQDPDIAYYMLRGLFASKEDMQYAFDEKGMRFDITAMVSAVVGGELLHTSGHYHNPLIKPEIYQVVSGTAIYLLQQHDMPADSAKLSEDQLKAALAAAPVIRSIAIIAKPGQPVVIPAGWGHVTVNPSLTEPLIMANWLTHRQSSAYGPYDTLSGPAYRIMTDLDGNITARPNENYPEGIPFIFATPKDVPELGLVTGESIYDIVSNKSIFNDLSEFLDEGKAPYYLLGAGQLSVNVISSAEAAQILDMKTVTMPPKASSAGYQEDIDAAIMPVSDVQRIFTDSSKIFSLDPAILEQYMSTLGDAIKAMETIRSQSPEAMAAVSSALTRVQASLDIVNMSSNMAAENAKIEQAVGTIVINENEIPSNQQILKKMLDKNNPYLQALEEKLGCKVRLLGQYNPNIDSAADMIAISSTAVDGITRRVNLNQVDADGYLPLEQIIVLAKGLLAYNQETRHALDSVITQMYRSITKTPISSRLLDAFLQNSVFVLELPMPLPIDEAYYEQLHRQALAALIAA